MRVLALTAAAACGDDGGDTGTAATGSSTATSANITTSSGTSAGSTSSASSSDATGTTTSTSSSTGDSSSDGSTGDPIFDVGGGNLGCEIGDDGVGECTDEAPPDSFKADVQWTWTDDALPSSVVTPLVANMTDDNDDGNIDLCDTPDVVVVARPSAQFGRVHVLDGATGAVHFEIDFDVGSRWTPALGDIDNDGEVELVTATPGGNGIGDLPSHIVAFETDGTMMWQNDEDIDHNQGGSLALADIDNDGDVEIIADDVVTDHLGNTVFVAPDQLGWGNGHHHTATVAADLDGDGDLELVLGQSAYHPQDGSLHYEQLAINPGFPQVADLDDDDDPEIIVNTREGITLLEHDGAIKFLELRPTGDPDGKWYRPSTVHDFDGDGEAEFAVSSANSYSVYERDASIVWSAEVNDSSGWAAGTAFDFLGDGSAEAMYADQGHFYAYNELGEVLMDVPRGSPTLTEYPVVADIDNDGSAEILVVSASNGNQPTIQAVRDAEDRWIQARRIWNQHTYHVTNVNEDGTIPQFEAPHWHALNTFRTNAQIEGGQVCEPAG